MVTELAPNVRYDVIFVVLRYTQLDSALETLRANQTKNIVFVGNNVQERWRRHCRRKMSCLPLRSLPGMKHKVKITILSALGVLLVGSSVAYAYSQKGTLISQKTEELPDGNIYVEELYEIDQ